MNHVQVTAVFKSPQSEKNYMDSYAKTLSLWPVPFDSMYVDTEYGKTHVIASGPVDGEPVILLNGFGFSATMWYPNIKELSAQYRVYAVDVIGEFNRSIAKKDFRRKEDYANWLAELFDRLHIQQAHLVGHSNGGWHALNFAMNAQHRVKKLILLAPAASFAPFNKQFGIRLLAANLIRTRSVIIGFCAKWFIGKDNRDKVNDSLLEQFYHGIVGFGWKHKILIPSVFSDEELRRISVPTLLLIGDREVIYRPKRVFSRAQRLIPHIQSRTLPGIGHALNLEHPEYINREMLRFLIS
jgi:pimeloyl-ACP methyl ester carboxylesterase